MRLSRVAWLANLRDRVPGAARARRAPARPRRGAAAADLAPRHVLARPRPRRRSPSAEATLAAARAGAKAAVLFVDTFNGIFESENALAAARVLKAAGYTLHTLDKGGGHHCCGRTFLASGMVDEARERVGALIDALLPFAEAGIADRRPRAVVPADAARRGAGARPRRRRR